MEEDLENPIKAERATVVFFEGLTVEGYRMPSGEFRVGLEGASTVLGFGENWLYRTLTRTGNKTLKTLQGWGLTITRLTRLLIVLKAELLT